jgi:hypothetical protein
MQKASGPGVVKLDGLTRVWDELELGRKEKKWISWLQIWI